VFDWDIPEPPALAGNPQVLGTRSYGFYVYLLVRLLGSAGKLERSIEAYISRLTLSRFSM
jgi:hypothetical protein